VTIRMKVLLEMDVDVVVDTMDGLKFMQLSVINYVADAVSGVPIIKDIKVSSLSTRVV